MHVEVHSDGDGEAQIISYGQYKVDGVLFECPADKYLPIKPVGRGAYGLVCSAIHTPTGHRVAIKRIADVFHNLLDARRTLREIRMLRFLGAHPNIVGLRDVYPPPTAPAFRDVYCVYECIDTDLHQLIRSPQLLTSQHIQLFTYQLVRALKYLHSAGILHRDLKPSNLLVNANCELKVCDFGLARAGVGGNDAMPEYVVTRWYRAPELLLACTGYDAAIDMWSVGCILAELLGRKPLFPGKDYIHTLNLVCKVVGTPTAEDLAAVPSDKARAYLHSMPPQPRANFRFCFPAATPEALDLLHHLLCFNPKKRLTAEEALRHPFFRSLHNPDDEPGCAAPMPPDPALDAMSVEQVRAAIFEEMKAFNPELGQLPPP